MLENADQIDWRSLGYHVYGQHEQIPTEIRNLLDPDASVRESARGFLLGEGQDYGDIYDTTPHILPFLIAILHDQQSSDRVELLAHISSVAEHVFYPHHISIHMKRLCLATYTAFQAGLPTFSAMLAENSREVRHASIMLLQYMTDDVEYLFPILIEQFHIETEEDMKIVLLYTLNALFTSLEWSRATLRNTYAPFFRKLLDSPISHTLRVAVARVVTELVGMYNSQNEKLFPEVAPILAKEFLERSSPLDTSEQHYPDYHTQQIASDIIRLEPEPFFEVLQHPTINAKQAHELARSLLINAFYVHSQKRWEYFPDSKQEHKGRFYIAHYVHHDVGPRTKAILQAIVDADKVWEVPTNLFSFFYGLPDSREALHTLIHQTGRGLSTDVHRAPSEDSSAF